MKYSEVASALIKKVKFAQLLEARIGRDKTRLITLGHEIFDKGGLTTQFEEVRIKEEVSA